MTAPAPLVAVVPPRSATLDDVLAEVRALRAEVAALHRTPAAKRPRRPSTADRGRLSLLYQALADVVGEMGFTAAELVERAQLPDAASRRLAAAVAAVAGSGRTVARRVGILLAHGEGVRVDGVVLERIGKERDSVVWVLRPAPDPRTSLRGAQSRR